MYMTYNYKKKGYKKKAYKKKATVSKKPKAEVKIKKAIKTYLSRQVETKICQLGGRLFLKTLSSSSTQAQVDGNCVMITPQGGTQPINCHYSIIGNGIGQDQRIGDEIRIKAQYFHYMAVPNLYDSTFNNVPTPNVLKIWLIQPKITNTLGIANNKILTGSATCDFFENQTNADSGLTGSLIDLMRKIDMDNYKVIAYKEHKIGYDGNLNTSNLLGSTPTSNTYQSYVKGCFKIKPYTWKVNRLELLQMQPIYILCQCIPVSPAVSQVPTIIPINLDYNLSTYYTDM